MVRTRAIACAIAVLAGAAPASAHAATTPGCAGAGTVVVDEATRQAAATTLLCLVNHERRIRQRSALRASTQLATAAAQQSTEMVADKYFSHDSPISGSLRERVERTGYMGRRTSTLIGETLAWGAGEFATPHQMVAAFLESPVHRRTMLNKSFREVGVGIALGAPVANVAMAAATATMDFGGRRR
ncbi:MAG: hypothetical protein QOJ35_3753 [Solirubrobacteraceae bacterium]|nr:hypothetical protein [Solirubrobacteraceae bacterium]